MTDKLSITELLEEYDLGIDDIRYYKSWVTARQLLTYSDNIDELVSYIWSGRLSDELHDMEDRYIQSLQEQLDRGLADETGIREILADAYALRNKRQWGH